MHILQPVKSILTLRPSIEENGPVIIVRNPLLLRVMLLFLFISQVEIDTSYRKITFTSRFLYFFCNSRVFSFDDLSHLDYDFIDFGTSWGFSISGGIFSRQDSLEQFTLHVVTKDKQKLKLCSFTGEGADFSGWSGVLLGGENPLDFSGTQAAESLRFAEIISNILGIPLGEKLQVKGLMTACLQCQREISRYGKRCFYCGMKIK